MSSTATPTKPGPARLLGYVIEHWQEAVGLVARLVLGITLLVAGLLKIGNLESMVLAVDAYDVVPYSLARVIGYVLPPAEVIVGALLIVGLFTRLSGLAGALMMFVFILGISQAWARGLSIDCGCFGGGGPISPEEAVAQYPWEILRDTALLACGAWLTINPKTLLSVDSWLFKPISPDPDQRD
ncbi:MAG: DoxX family protein [Propionibacteriaceae bacterium]|nr:DoxX family protein [Propionibacteriaceae bacterium]